MDPRTLQIICLFIGWFVLIHQFYEVKGTGKFLNVPASGKRKRPGVALALNAVLLCMGLGYLYLGEWKRFLFYFFGWQIAFLTGFPKREEYIGILIAIWAFTLYDGYARAKKTQDPNYVISRPKRAWVAYGAMILIPAILAAAFREVAK